MKRKYFIAKTYYAIFFIHYVWELTDICLTTEFSKNVFFQNCKMFIAKCFYLTYLIFFHIGITCISINFSTLWNKLIMYSEPEKSIPFPLWTFIIMNYETSLLWNLNINCTWKNENTFFFHLLHSTNPLCTRPWCTTIPTNKVPAFFVTFLMLALVLP